MQATVLDVLIHVIRKLLTFRNAAGVLAFGPNRVGVIHPMIRRVVGSKPSFNRAGLRHDPHDPPYNIDV